MSTQQKMNDFAWHLSMFLSKYLPGQKNLSTNTIASYRDTFKLFLVFLNDAKKLKPQKVTLSLIKRQTITEFLEWIEKKRKCCISTRNQRLSAIHAFFRYVQNESPDSLFEIHKILTIPPKRKPKPLVSYLTDDELRILFKQPNTDSRQGRRDLVMLVLMYDTAARVSELTDLKVGNIRLSSPAVITLHGKGGKARHVPIIGRTKDESPGKLNRSWARLIQKIYEVDPLLCPRCGKKMKIIAFIEDYKIVKKILDHVGIYEFERKRPPPKIDSSPDEFDDYIRDDYIDCDHVC